MAAESVDSVGLDSVQVADALEEIAALLQLGGGQSFRVRAYQHAAQIVRASGPGLARIVEQGQLSRLAGIGPALSRQIEELWRRGSSVYLERLRSSYPPGAAELARVPGMTLKRIQALHAGLGIASIAQLQAACAAGRVRELRGFGTKTEQRLGEACEGALLARSGPAQPLILAAALELAGELQAALCRVSTQVQLVGELRRGEETVGEIEFAVQPEVSAALQELEGAPQIVRVDFAERVAHSTAGLPIRLHGVRRGWGNTLVEATGTPRHVDALVARAKRLGRAIGSAAIDSAAIGGGGAPPTQDRAPELEAFASERELYASLDLCWVPPELRVGTDELEQAERGTFDELVQNEDIVGMVHCHSNYSDGKNSILEMARAAQALGMQYITITDHSASAHYARGLPVSQLQRQWDEISAAQAEVQIRILRGSELDILADGQLDYPDAVLEQFDVLIASIHARHRADRETMSRRLMRALSYPLFKIWGHPLGRILNHRDAIDCDMRAVLDVLAGAPGAIEINADPHRLDLPPAWIPAARERGIPFVIAVDAHSTSGFGVLEYGVTMARRGAVRAREVLNTLPVDSFARSVKPTGSA